MNVDVLLPLALAFIMFSVGLSLRGADFRAVFARPAGLAVGLAGQLLLVPLAALAVAVAAGLPGPLAAGLLILGACPGGASSGFLTHLARGNAALSISLTVISSLAALFTFPLLAHWALGAFADTPLAAAVGEVGQLPVGRLIGSVLVVTTLPVLLGMAARRFAPGASARVERPVGRVATAFFAAIVIGTFAAHRNTILDNLAAVGPATLALNFAVMAGGWGLARLAGCGRPDRVAVAMECGLQNAGLAIFVALGLLQRPELAVAAVVYALVMNFGALGLLFVARRPPAAVPVSG